MRQLTFIKPGTLEWWDVPLPRIEGAGQALVRPLAVARCDLDLWLMRGTAPLQGPFAMGHEMVGVVTEVGEGVARFQPGDRVVVPFQISCGTCDNCRRGRTATCSNVPRLASYGMKPLSGTEFGGALSDLVRVPYADHMLVGVPGSLRSEAIASVADNIPDGWRAVAPHLQATPGAAVLVMGGAAQSVGLYAAQAAVALGASRVLYVDDDATRLRIAKTIGAEVLELKAAPGTRPPGQFPITVDASGNPQALQLAIRSTAPGGVCSPVAIYFEDQVQLPLLRMYTTGITLHVGRVHARGDLPQVLEKLVQLDVRAEAITERTVPFSEAIEAMADGAPKIVFANEQA
jgi:threonine dehydrogenase-like Zn-dependent dehydrogenase